MPSCPRRRTGTSSSVTRALWPRPFATRWWHGPSFRRPSPFRAIRWGLGGVTGRAEGVEWLGSWGAGSGRSGRPGGRSDDDFFYVSIQLLFKRRRRKSTRRGSWHYKQSIVHENYQYSYSTYTSRWTVIKITKCRRGEKSCVYTRDG